MRVLYSYNKRGREAAYWQKEIAQASSDDCVYVPFNHDSYLDPNKYIRAQLLDNLYYDKHPGLMRLYKDFEAVLRAEQIDAVVVDACNPYHPDYLRRFSVYKALRTCDGPIAAYERDLAYAHAFDQVLYHSRAYSEDMEMPEKLAYCGVKRADFWPLAVFRAARDGSLLPHDIRQQSRDVDIVFVGAMHLGKMPLLAQVKRRFRGRLRMHGYTTLKRNAYFNLKFGFPGWIRPLPADAYVPLYCHSKLGFNVHNRGMYTVGSYRLFELPANGVMQISDGGAYLKDFYEPGKEIVAYDSAEELVEKLVYYLEHEEERIQIAQAGLKRTLRDHTIEVRMRQLTALLRAGMSSGMELRRSDTPLLAQ